MFLIRKLQDYLSKLDRNHYTAVSETPADLTDHETCVCFGPWYLLLLWLLDSPLALIFCPGRVCFTWCRCFVWVVAFICMFLNRRREREGFYKHTSLSLYICTDATRDALFIYTSWIKDVHLKRSKNIPVGPVSKFHCAVMLNAVNWFVNVVRTSNQKPLPYI